MDVKITYRWLLEYLETNASAQKVQECLTLTGPSIEKLTEENGEEVLHIEVTPNRVDMASVWGIAKEAVAALPQYGFEAAMRKQVSLSQEALQPLSSSKEPAPVTLEVKGEGLVGRYILLTLRLSEGKVSPVIAKRLEACGVQSVNGIVDISNYVMLELGMPSHIFDTQSIAGLLTLREAREKETITLLDGSQKELLGGEIVIEKDGNIVDLCGVMGGKESGVREDSKLVTVLVPVYDALRVRKASLAHNTRTLAATYFEKKPDPSLATAAMVRIGELLKEYYAAEPVGALVDYFPSSQEETHVVLEHAFIEKFMGVTIETALVQHILKSLGFGIRITQKGDSLQYEIQVPSYRKYDVTGTADIVEEIARIYGYHRLPSVVQPVVPMVHYLHSQETMDAYGLRGDEFSVHITIKRALKHAGFHELLTYSFFNKNILPKLNLKEEDHLLIKDSFSQEFTCMRTSLFPTLLGAVAGNQGKKEVLNFFELSRVYIKQEGKLPKEDYRLIIASTGSLNTVKEAFFAMLREFYLDKKVQYGPAENRWFKRGVQAAVYAGEAVLATFGEVKQEYLAAMGIKTPLFGLEMSVEALLTVKGAPRYERPVQYALIKQDVTLKRGGRTYSELVKHVQTTCSYLHTIEFMGSYEDTYTLRLTFTNPHGNITEEEVRKEIEKLLEKENPHR